MTGRAQPHALAWRAGDPSVSARRGARVPALAARLGGSAPLLVVAVAVSIQAGSALATTLFASAGVAGTVWLRVSLATVLLLAIGRRGVRVPRAGSRLTIVGLGVVLAAMNVCFYESIARIPLGVAATVDFAGPLLVALVGSRGRVELGCAALAGAGVVLLGAPTTDLDGTGLAFAFASAACWAAYILLAKRAVTHGEPLSSLVCALAVSTILLAPWALAAGGGSLWHGSVLATALGVAVLATALPYLLELAALRLVRASTFGVLLSLEPAVAAIVGFAALGQRLGSLEVAAVACVVLGSAGASRRSQAPPLA